MIEGVGGTRTCSGAKTGMSRLLNGMTARPSRVTGYPSRPYQNVGAISGSYKHVASARHDQAAWLAQWGHSSEVLCGFWLFLLVRAGLAR